MKYLAVLLLLLFGVWAYLLPGKDDMPNQSAVRYELKINGTAPGQVELRMRTSSNIPPTYVNCSTMTLSDESWAPALTDFGRSKFEVPDDVQSAMNAAVADALESILEQEFTACVGAGGDDPDYPPCAGRTSGAVIEIVNDATVTAQVYWSTGSFEEVNPGDEWYEECNAVDGSSYFPSVLKLDITAPPKQGVDLSIFLRAINWSAIPDSSQKTEFMADVEAMLENDLIVTPVPISGGYGLDWFGGPGGAYMISVSNTASMKYISISNGIVGLGGWFDNSSGSWVSGDHTVSFSGYWENHPQFVISADDPPIYVPGVFGTVSFFNETAATLTINLEIPFTNNWDDPDPTKWHLATDYQPDDSDIVRSTGALSAATTYNTYLKDPGFRSYCQWDCTYVNRRPWLKFCGENEMQLNVYHANGFVHPIGKFPACKIMVKALKTEDV